MSSVALSSSSSTESSLLSSLGGSSSSSGTSSIASDLQAYTTAKSSGDTSTADAAVVQLKSDLAAEQNSLVSMLTGSTDSSTDSIGSNLLGSLAATSNASAGSQLSVYA